MRKVSRLLLAVSIGFFLLPPPEKLAAKDLYSVYCSEPLLFGEQVREEYDLYSKIRAQYPELFAIVEEIRDAVERNAEGPEIERLLAEYLYQKSLIQQKNQGALVAGFVIIALFGVGVVFSFLLYFMFINERQKQQLVLSAIISEVEKERSRISRELHDTVAQDLRASSITRDEAERTALELKAISVVRDICFNLNPPGLEDARLEASLRELCENFQEKSGIETNVYIDAQINFDALEQSLSQENKVNLYRIVQEALGNVQKHSGSDSASVTVQEAPGTKRSRKVIVVEVSDDGVGFDVDSWFERDERARHFGLHSMNQRAQLMGGTLRVTSEPNCGTVVRLEILCVPPPPRPLQTGVRV